ncbi:hypothetical protein DFJ74DRAFT_24718 [Hyaloraphidium curvatum]|nr:hypothetical protein DFJ74DRAFT_24718 [Hyaloraphidium curvatum]
MPAVGAYSAVLVVASCDAREFPRPPGPAVYVESATGAPFAVRVKSDDPRPVTADVYVDGKFAQGRVLEASGESLVDGALGADRRVRPFRFARPKLVADGDEGADELLEAQTREGSEAGQIRVEFWRWRVRSRGARRRNPDPDSDDDYGGAQQVALHERAKKGALLSHTTDFDDPLDEELPPIDGEVVGDEPLAVVAFEYRSRGLLEALGVDVGSKGGVKREGESGGGGPAGKKLRVEPGGVIDLTGDD